MPRRAGREGKAAAAKASPLPLPPPSHCAPVRAAHHRATGTCLMAEDVRELAALYNASGGRGGAGLDLAAMSTEALLRELRRRAGLATDGAEDHALLRQPFVAAAPAPLLRRLRDAFRPPMPAAWRRQPRAWLSNRDIENVMRQYEAMVPDFEFVGVFPMDFAAPADGTADSKRRRPERCVSQAMCDFSLPGLLARRKRHAGIVLNLDRHDQRGSHWVCLYVGADPAGTNYGVYYYDSVARRAPPEVRAFMAGVARQARALPGSRQQARRFASAVNTVRRQYQNTECGIFAMFFLCCCLSDRLCFHHICESMGFDENVAALRHTFFSDVLT